MQICTSDGLFDNRLALGPDGFIACRRGRGDAVDKAEELRARSVPQGANGVSRDTVAISLYWSTMSQADPTPDKGAMSRRRALKAGVAGAGAVAVWSEPTIRGLARRPAYAAGGSGPAVIQTVTITGTINGDGATRTVDFLAASPAAFGTGADQVAITLTASGQVSNNFPAARNVDLGPVGLTWEPGGLNYNDMNNIINENHNNTNATRLRIRNGAPAGDFTIIIDITCPAGLLG